MTGPNANLDVSDAGLALIAGFEGFQAQLYDDVAGNATIGYGHLLHLGPITQGDRDAYGKGITQQAALALLREDAAKAVVAVRTDVTVPLRQNQFDALVSLVFNIGATHFASSTLLDLLNAGDFAGAQAQFAVWDHAGGKVVPGLQNRRAAEAALFGGTAAPAPAPPPAPAAGWYSRLLSQGARGDDVRAAQRLLGIPADGIFGPATAAAVRAFQQRHGLSADGVIGPRTAAAL